ncbi:acid protease [Daldinia sp. FL1419]|nr:acid protease [Daldinia sp. FL1419]
MAGFMLQVLAGFLIFDLGVAIPVDPVLETRAFVSEAGLTITDRYQTLKRVQRKPGVSQSVDVRRQIRRSIAILDDLDGTTDDSGDVERLSTGLRQLEYVLEVKIGAEPFYMVPDTGSSDTWVAADEFTCLDPTSGQQIPRQGCGFGPLYKGDFPDGKLDNTNMNISISVAGLTVPKQQFALVDIAAFRGDNVSSGILGLGFRGLTAAFKGSDPRNDTISNSVNYSPFVETTGASGAAEPILGFSLSPDENRSYISFEVCLLSRRETTPPFPFKSNGKTDYLYYDIAIDFISWNSSTVSQIATDLPHMLVDSGTIINLFPLNVAAAINNAFTPAGKQQNGGVWSVPCDVVPPTLDVVIGGRAIRTHPDSLIVQVTLDDGSPGCTSGIGAGQPDAYILGDTFMEEIVAVFDVSDKKQMKFAQRLD